MLDCRFAWGNALLRLTILIKVDIESHDADGDFNRSLGNHRASVVLPHALHTTTPLSHTIQFFPCLLVQLCSVALQNSNFSLES